MSERFPDLLPDACVPFAQALIDDPSGATSDREMRGHLESCHSCHALAGSLAEVAPILVQVAREEEEDLLWSLRSRARSAVESSERVTSGRWGLLSALLRSRLRWAAACVAALLLLAAVVHWQMNLRPVGQLTLASAEVVIGGLAVEPGGDAAVRRGDFCQVGEGTCLITLEGGIRLALAPGTQIQVHSPHEVQIEEGEIFVLAGESEDLTVSFFDGTIETRGGAFGLDLTTRWPTLDVLAGGVDVACTPGESRFEAGQVVVLDYFDGYLTSPREGGEWPLWVADLLDSSEM